ncbi:MAG: ATP-dependent DNA helicase RecG [Propionibacteriales bacterium]|nr:ATP-dependent DNA helicase RecG [Propionibacteriales bacterium]
MADVLRTRLDRLLGAATAKKLKSAFEMETGEDLLRHYPRRYVQRGELSDLGSLELGEYVTVIAAIDKVDSHPYQDRRTGRRRERVEVKVVGLDGSGDMRLTFFQLKGWRGWLQPGRLGMFAGKVELFKGRRQLTHPEMRIFDEEEQVEEYERMAGALIPIYPASAKLASWRIEGSVRVLLDQLGELEDPIPDDAREKHGLVDLSEALRLIHRPSEPADHQRARARLRFEEAFVTQVVLAQRRHETAALPAVPRTGRQGGLLDRFDASLPFEPTAAQDTVGHEILLDLAGDHPMHRLLQGEVGSGKTLVALRAMLRVVDSGGQAALLAPTEVLAQQHHRAVCDLLGDLAEGGMLGGAEDGTRVVLLTGSSGTAARREALLDAASGAAGIVIGTHALLEERVQFADLGLVVVDEQHRFGVEQRAALSGKAGDRRPHVLVMTATPIPRTVAMTAFGDLDVSVMRDLPPGRVPIQTTVVPAAERPTWLDRAWGRIREEVENGHQAYVVCVRIGGEPAEDPELVDAPADRPQPLAVTDVAAQLSEGPLAGLRLEALHGRMAPDEKDRVMRAFARGELDVLVSTTVIEVGVDVPNASVMVVLDAERFGVSQLHQLRGRVGRGKAAGLCLLVTDMPPDTPSRARLDAVAGTNDGFELARVDLEARREGDVLGAVQSGRRSSLRLLSVIRHEEVIASARESADRVVGRDPSLASYPPLARAVADLVESQRADYLEKT